MFLRKCLFVSLCLLLISPAAWAMPRPWSQRFGDEDYESGKSVTTDNDKNVIVTGYFEDDIDFGGDPLQSAGGYDIFLAKFDPNGNHIWSESFGVEGEYDQLAYSVTTGWGGEVIVTGFFQGSVNFGGATLTSAGGYDIFVASFNPDGSHDWSKRFGDSNNQSAYSVASKWGKVYVTGSFSGMLNFGPPTTPLVSAGASDIFLARLDENGNPEWSKKFGDGAIQQAQSVTVDRKNKVIVTGFFQGSVNFGGGDLTSEGATDIFLAKFEDDGDHIWSKSFGSLDDQFAYSVAADPLDHSVIVTGDFENTVNFGGETYTSVYGPDMFVAKFDKDGNHVWSRGFGNSEIQHGFSVTVDWDHNAIVTGGFQGRVDFGGGTLSSADSFDVFLAKFDPNGEHIWSERFGYLDDQHANSVTADGQLNVIVTGTFADTVNFGQGPLRSSSGSFDVFVAKLILSRMNVPTLGWIGMVIFTALLGLVGIVFLRRKVATSRGGACQGV